MQKKPGRGSGPAFCRKNGENAKLFAEKIRNLNLRIAVIVIGGNHIGLGGRQLNLGIGALEGGRHLDGVPLRDDVVVFLRGLFGEAGGLERLHGAHGIEHRDLEFVVELLLGGGDLAARDAHLGDRLFDAAIAVSGREEALRDVAGGGVVPEQREIRSGGVERKPERNPRIEAADRVIHVGLGGFGGGVERPQGGRIRRRNRHQRFEVRLVLAEGAVPEREFRRLFESEREVEIRARGDRR